jgi:membrane protein required for colicin V production
MEWHWLDWVIVGVVALSAITGMFRGFVKELVALLVWGLGLYASYRYAPTLDPVLAPYIHDNTARTVASFVLILLGILIAGAIFNAILGALLRKAGLSGTDRMLGMGFGVVRGIFIVALVMLMVSLTSLPKDDYRKESILYAKFDPVVDWISSFMPEFIQKVKTYDKGVAMTALDTNAVF